MKTPATSRAPFRGFDVETRPRLDLVAKLAEPPAPFDPEGVKYGNTKDPVKRAALLEQRRQEHEEQAADALENQRKRAALDPLTGEVCVIGTIDESFSISLIQHPTEIAILRAFWTIVAQEGDAAIRWLFWSGAGDINNHFDLDFVVTRSRILGVRVPSFVRSGRYYSARLFCLAKEFLLYKREKFLSLTRAGEVFDLYSDGVEPKLERKREDDPVTGENFHLWWDGKATKEHPAAAQRSFALRYLDNDLRHLAHLAIRIL